MKPTGSVQLNPPPTSHGFYAIVLYPFEGIDDTELTVKPNDVIHILNQYGEWWEGEFHGKKGLVPAAYMKQMK